MILLIALQALWASSIPLSKVLLGMVPPVFLAGIRMFIAGIMLLAYQWWCTKEGFNLQKKHWWFYFQIIFFGIYLKYILRYWGLVQLSTAKLSFILNITPFCVALFSYISFNEHLSLQKWLGLIIGFLGLVPILFIANDTELIAKESWFFSWAEIATFAEIIAHSYALIVMRKMVKDTGYSAGMTNGIRMFGGGILALMTVPLAQESVTIAQPLYFVGLLATLIIVSNIVCHNLYIYLLKHYSATFLSFSDFLSPLCVAFYGWLFLHELITWHYVLSGIIVLVGLCLFYHDELELKIPLNVARFLPASLSFIYSPPPQESEIEKQL